MLDMTETTKAKSDQLNAVDIACAPMTITITGIKKANDEKQPIQIEYEGGEGRPYKPCLGMRRGLVALWGIDGEQYIGRALTLYCDPTVVYAGKEEGGIRISHASHIDKPVKFKLVLTRGKSIIHTIEPLSESEPSRNEMSEEDFGMWCSAINSCKDMASLSAIGGQIKTKKYDDEASARLKDEYTKAMGKIRESEGGE